MIDRFWLVVDRLRLMVDRCWSVNWLRFMVDRGRGIDRFWLVIDRLWLMIDRFGGIVRLWFVVSRGRWVIRFLFWVVRGAFISDLSHIAIVVVSSVFDMLDPAIWQGNGVGTTDNIAI